MSRSASSAGCCGKSSANTASRSRSELGDRARGRRYPAGPSGPRRACHPARSDGRRPSARPGTFRIGAPARRVADYHRDMYFDALSFLEDERDAWRPYEALFTLTPEHLELPVAGEDRWSARDLLGHLVFWQERALAVARELAVGPASPSR